MFNLLFLIVLRVLVFVLLCKSLSDLHSFEQISKVQDKNINHRVINLQIHRSFPINLRNEEKKTRFQTGKNLRCSSLAESRDGFGSRLYN